MADDLHRGGNPDVPTITATIDADGEVKFGPDTPEQIGRVLDKLTQRGWRARAKSAAGLDDGDVYPAPSDEDFLDAHGREMEFIDAPDLEEIARDLAAEFDLIAVQTFRVKFLWRVEESSGAQGKCIKANGPLKHLTGADYVIWAAASTVRESGYTAKQVRALVHHELLHIRATEKGKPATRKHDVEVFREEVETYGLWDDRLKYVFGQMELPL